MADRPEHPVFESGVPAFLPEPEGPPKIEVRSWGGARNHPPAPPLPPPNERVPDGPGGFIPGLIAGLALAALMAQFGWILSQWVGMFPAEPFGPAGQEVSAGSRESADRVGGHP